MTPKQFIEKLKKDKTISYFEFIFIVDADNKVIVEDQKKQVCDREKYVSPAEAYFAYSNIIKYNKKDNLNPKKMYFGRANWRKKELAKM